MAGTLLSFPYVLIPILMLAGLTWLCAIGYEKTLKAAISRMKTNDVLSLLVLVLIVLPVVGFLCLLLVRI